jgi:hypothetical protein
MTILDGFLTKHHAVTMDSDVLGVDATMSREDLTFACLKYCT